ncbi:hypothetical protein CXP34_18655 [Ralstonia mannitolilytica]|nr:hypothetical protein CXP34_18655 [Ralstonia mannitolilytica]
MTAREWTLSTPYAMPASAFQKMLMQTVSGTTSMQFRTRHLHVQHVMDAVWDRTFAVPNVMYEVQNRICCV